jgi:hypothetical protein
VPASSSIERRARLAHIGPKSSSRNPEAMASPTMVPLLIALLIFATTNAADIKINPAAITHTIVWTHGCHTDLGYSHQQRGIFAQLLHGESFENFSVPQLRGGPDSGAAAVATAGAGTDDVTADACLGHTCSSCFGKGDELVKIPNISTAAGCCAACAQYTGCNVWTVRSGPDGGGAADGSAVASGCHLRSSWEHSEPVPGPCTTGVLGGGALPPSAAAAAATTTQWRHRTAGREGSAGTAGLSGVAPLNGNQVATLSLAANAAPGNTVSYINAGFWEEGLDLQAGQAYEGYVFVRVEQPGAVSLSVALEDQVSGTVLASSTHSVPSRLPGAGAAAVAESTWQQLNFTLTPSRPSSPCTPFPWGAAPQFCEPDLAGRSGNSCLRCAGAFGAPPAVASFCVAVVAEIYLHQDIIFIYMIIY